MHDSYSNDVPFSTYQLATELQLRMKYGQHGKDIPDKIRESFDFIDKLIELDFYNLTRMFDQLTGSFEEALWVYRCLDPHSRSKPDDRADVYKVKEATHSYWSYLMQDGGCGTWRHHTSTREFRHIYEKINNIVQNTGIVLNTSHFKDERQLRTGNYLKKVIDVQNFDDGLEFCAEVPFQTQPVVSGFCSGFLAAPDIFITAGHCIKDEEVFKENTRIVFNYEMLDEHDHKNKFDAGEIFKVVDILEMAYDENGEGYQPDYAILKLDHKFTSFKQVDFRNVGQIRNGPVYLVGHPYGLPKKFTPGGHVTAIFKHIFKCNLDGFGGNSGSPVINALTHEIEGIFIHGLVDPFYHDRENNCIAHKIADIRDPSGSINTKIGEKVVYTSCFYDLLKKYLKP